MNFEGKTYIVTGASSGMGKCTCQMLLESNAHVIGIDMNTSDISNKSYTHYIADVRDENKIEQIFAEVKNSFKQIDGLVNAAGVFANNKPFYELDLNSFEKVMSINTTGTFLVSKAAAKLMIPNNKGKIVNISCIRSVIFKNNMADYAASKGAVSSMTSAMALDLAPFNIQVNAVAPGFIYTGMTSKSFDIPEVRKASEGLIPNGRLGMPKDIASVILFLLSESSDYVTGSVIYADGGYHIQK